ncbi:hypothetical protein HMPREF0682_0391 [Propionibacterium acidifaciens F0233]|uniref:Uncharacterized protein n=1 Tax=Propionibacterium acidifaciens F0233 TaxID=553198 RepID=U2RZS4_9ACTN|nr:hypothetical protein HMPREF0682_0391 [Propionibacterium acidifaciens F0233]
MATEPAGGGPAVATEAPTADAGPPQRSGPPVTTPRPLSGAAHTALRQV